MHISAEHPVVRAVTRDPPILARFWDAVDRAESADACWEWRGRRSSDGHPILGVKSHTVSAARLAWFAATGEFPFGGKLRRSCQNNACVRPEHLAWQLGMMAAEQQLRTAAGRYVAVSATPSGAPTRGDDEALYRRAG